MHRKAAQLVSITPATDLWEDMTPWMTTIGVLGVRGALIIVEKTGTFQARVGIQTAVSDPEVADTPLAPVDAGGSGLGYFTTVSKNFFTFDPTLAAAGDINRKMYFRIGALYRSSDAVIGRGNVMIKAGFRMG